MSNGSGHGTGLYASEQQRQDYLSRMGDYLARRNAAWLDRNTDWMTGEVREGVRDLCGLWVADSHLAEWAVRTGRLDPSTVPRDGIKHRQIGRLTAVVFFRSEEDHRALARELERWLSAVEAELLSNGEETWDR